MNHELIAKKIRAYRLDREWTTEELARATGLSFDFHRRLEEGLLRKVHVFTYQKIADALSIKIEDLLDPSPIDDKPEELPNSLERLADFSSYLVVFTILLVMLYLLAVLGNISIS